MNQPNRKARRVQASQLRRQQGSQAADLATSAPEIPVRLGILEQNFSALNKVSAQNTHAFQMAHIMTDAHIAVMYRVLNDMDHESRPAHVVVGPHTVTPAYETQRQMVYRDTSGNINLQRYHEEFAAVMGAYEFMIAYSRYIDAVKAEAEAEIQDRETTPGPLAPLPDFGGDVHAQG